MTTALHRQPVEQSVHQKKQTADEPPQKTETGRPDLPSEPGRLRPQKPQLRSQSGLAKRVNDVLHTRPTVWSSMKKHRGPYCKPVNEPQKTTDRLEAKETPPSDAEGDEGMDKQHSSLKEADNEITWSQLEKAAESDFDRELSSRDSRQGDNEELGKV
ncbi:hypothetical protein NDU88_005888 [Pleurodeles waltl]|uniref:Uncharacterized protein n=1 Tax=Pleurodeles waltl TaxID=8319 RepID=A0AAV7QJJ1_PLEWA|nr:hypothetical protein NDU88_005888 [Pleurodeles waltl]